MWKRSQPGFPVDIAWFYARFRYWNCHVLLCAFGAVRAL